MPNFFSQSPVDFTGYTVGGDDLTEWNDSETQQYAVTIDRNRKGLSDITLYCGSPEESHALFLALCEVHSVVIDGEQE